MTTRNLGIVKALHVGTIAPTNTNMIWRDTSLTIPLHKAYDTTSGEWKAFIYLTLIDNVTIKKDEDGKLYVDVSTIPELQVADGSITLVKLSNVASGTVFYRKSEEEGVPEVQTLATLKEDLGLEGENSGDQDLSDLVPKSLTINDKSLNGNIILTPEDIGSPEGDGVSTGENTGDETQETILLKLGLEGIAGINTGDETYESILALFEIIPEEGDEYTLIKTTDLERLLTVGGTTTITLPSNTTVSGRISGATEGTDYPTGWVLAIGDSEYDLLITHNQDRKVANVSVFSVDGQGKERVLIPFNNAYTGILTPNSNSVQIEALTEVQTQIKIYITFA